MVMKGLVRLLRQVRARFVKQKCIRPSRTRLMLRIFVNQIRRSWSRTRDAVRRLSSSLTRFGKHSTPAATPRPHSQYTFPVGPSPNYLERAGSLKVVSSTASALGPERIVRRKDTSKGQTGHKRSASDGDNPVISKMSLENVAPRQHIQVVHPGSTHATYIHPPSSYHAPGPTGRGRAASLKAPETWPTAPEPSVRRSATGRPSRAVPLEVARDRFMAPPDPAFEAIERNDAARRAARLRSARATLEQRDFGPPTKPRASLDARRTASPVLAQESRRSREEDEHGLHGLRRTKRTGSLKRADPASSSRRHPEQGYGYGHSKEPSHASTASGMTASASSRVKYTSLH